MIGGLGDERGNERSERSSYTLCRSSNGGVCLQHSMAHGSIIRTNTNNNQKTHRKMLASTSFTHAIWLHILLTATRLTRLTIMKLETKPQNATISTTRTRCHHACQATFTGLLGSDCSIKVSFILTGLVWRHFLTEGQSL
jgi:hypothetical protein